MEPAARADLYAFFSRLWLREVDENFARALQGPMAGELLPRFAASPERAAVLEPSSRESVFDADFAHLTVVGLVPCASFFLREDARIEAGLQNPVVAFYRDHGFEVDLGVARALSADHLGVELEFLSVLARTEARAEDPAYRRSLVDVRRAFLAEHVAPWAPVYLLAARRAAHTVLYGEGAEAALEWILTDLGAA